MHKIPKAKYWADKYAKEFWDDTVDHPIRWTNKYKKFWGKVIYYKKDLRLIEIVLSDKLIKNKKQFHLTLKHELCHYFLLKKKINHSEFGEEFLSELRRVGGSMPHKHITTEWYCSHCMKLVYSHKKWLPRHFQHYKKCDCMPLDARGKLIWQQMT